MPFLLALLKALQGTEIMAAKAKTNFPRRVLSRLFRQRRIPGTSRRLRSSMHLQFQPYITPRLEDLESRVMLATLTVNTADDTVNGNDELLSLREAVLAANETPGADKILFDNSLLDSTFNLSLGEMEITEELSIDGTSARFTNIDAGGASRIFNITASSGDFLFQGVTLTGGQVTDSPGGAIHSESSGVLTINRSTVSASSTGGANAHGGGISAAGDVSIFSSTISGNSTSGASAFGGGVYAAGDVRVDNSTVSGNSTSGGGAYGGGVFAGRNIDIINATVFQNSTTGDGSHGGGIFSAGEVTFFSSIVAGNFVSSVSSLGPDLFGSGSIQSDRSLIGDNRDTLLAESQTVDGNGNFIGSSTGSGVIDPLLGPLTNNGGPTQTHALLPDSLAVDAGVEPERFFVDQRGAPFFRINNSPNFTPPDMGAFEIQLVEPNKLIVTTQKDIVDGDISSISAITDNPGADGLISLREAVLATNNTENTSSSDTIKFDPSLDGLTITLSIEGRDEDAGLTGDLDITESVVIFGNFRTNPDGVLEPIVTFIDAGGIDRIFDLTVGAGRLHIIQTQLTGGRTESNGLAGGGGAIRSLANSSLSITLSGSILTGNSTAGDDAHGGAVYAISNITINRNTISGNSTTGDRSNGGGVYVKQGEANVHWSTVSGNSTAGDDAGGGGVSADGDVRIRESTISGNSTAGDRAKGGGVFASGTVTLEDSTISGNSTTGLADDITAALGSQGGGIYAAGDVNSTNSTISGNSTLGKTADGGGVFTYGNVSLYNSTVTRNSTQGHSAEGGGIYVADDNAVTIVSTIVAGNTTELAAGPDLFIADRGAKLQVDHSLIGDNDGTRLVESQSPDDDGNFIGSFTGGGVINPRLAPLDDYGGFTENSTDLLVETHALLPSSPAVDAGSDPLDLKFDQRTDPFARLVGDQVDIGAFEGVVQAGTLRLTVTTAEDELDEEDLDGMFDETDLSLREAIELTNRNPGADRIRFDESLVGLPINLNMGELEINDELSITGLGAGDTTIDAGSGSRIFNITIIIGNFTFAGLTLTGGHTSKGPGGAIRSISYGQLTITDSTISGNSTSGDNGYGGGIFTRGDISLSGSTVSGNSTTGTEAGGGGIYAYGAVTLTGSTISGNSTYGAKSYGGGISTRGIANLFSSTVTENSTTGSGAEGGGISAAGGAVITGSIVAGNTTDSAPGPDLFSFGTFSINYSLIGDNTDTSLAEAQTPDANGNLIGSSNGNGIIDSLLGPLADNGGQMLTHALLPGSPAFDSGDPDVVAGVDDVPLYDQRGEPFFRISGGRIDMGSFEEVVPLMPITLLVTTTDDELDDVLDVEFDPTDMSLREAIALTNRNPGPDEIVFDQSLAGLPINLNLGEFILTDDLTITGLGSSQTTIDAGGASRIFNITTARGDFTFDGLTLSGGQTTGEEEDGGAIRSQSSGLLTITGSNVSGNSTPGIEARGGGIYAYGDLSLNSSTISGNSTGRKITNRGASYYVGDSGGGIFARGDVNASGSTISGNFTLGGNSTGGGIHVSGNLSLTGSTLSGNYTRASSGGGIYSRGDVDLTNSTVFGNFIESGGFAGGIFADGDIVISGSILAGNTVSDTVPFDFFGTLTMENSLLGDNLGGSPAEAHTPDANGNLVGSRLGSGIIDPLLGPLTDNGGPTETHALLPGSPAIDVGSNPDGIQFDQRGDPFARVFGAGPDMGAFELQDEPTEDIIGDSNRDGHFNVFDILQVLVAGKYSTGEPATWEEGDWNEDGLFNVFDIILALTEGNFEGGQQAAVLNDSNSRDESTSSTAPISTVAVDRYYNQEETSSLETLEEQPEILDSIELIAVKRRR